jgi:hypothetical protein
MPPSANAQAKSRFIYNGIHYASWWHDEYEACDQATSSMSDLASTNANWVGVLVTWYQANATATTICPDGQKTHRRGGQLRSPAVSEPRFKGDAEAARR